MTFQASNDKERHFLDLLDEDLKPIEPSYSKRGSWLKFFGHSNLLCVVATTRHSRTNDLTTSKALQWAIK